MAGKVDCPRCRGSGFDDASGFGHEVVCEECQGSGKVDADQEPDQEDQCTST